MTVEYTKRAVADLDSIAAFYAEPAMTSIWLFAYVVLPVVVVGLGWAALKLNERSMRDRLHPGE
jgi:hypothetical protein